MRVHKTAPARRARVRRAGSRLRDTWREVVYWYRIMDTPIGETLAAIGWGVMQVGRWAGRRLAPRTACARMGLARRWRQREHARLLAKLDRIDPAV